ncbi:MULTISPECIES: DNA topoisomerase IB [Sphingobacterium]|uniref:DNA topoisomerase IB n=1 Tax=Sphingobacterium TaxID=28453 RepID=UPI0013DCC3CF|nr:MULTISPECIES: DNA topoisomerase IB [unclassified Sphingobacterium]
MPATDRIIPDSEALLEAGLRYVSCKGKGYQRVRHGKHFKYLDQNGNPIQNPQTLARIQALVIPPAWEQVWICATANGHIQATGIDARLRKQYLYHPAWSQLRKKDKFSALYIFGQRLSRLQKHILNDLSSRQLSKERICALALAVMSKTYFRIGNAAYEKENKSYGLTTLRNRHVDISTTKVFFKFIGKKGIPQQSYLTEKSLVRLLAKVKEIPGQRLFQYYDQDGQATPLDSGTLNAYLKAATHADITCKTFRTWYGCILTLHYLGKSEIPTSATARKQQLLAVIDQVAQQLGNTRSITRSHYIHPYIQESYLQGDLDNWIKRVSATPERPSTDALYKRKLMQLIRSASYNG